MRAVRTGKGITDINITKRRQRSGKITVIGLLTRVEAQVFQHQDIAVLHRSNGISCLLAGNITYNRHGPAQQRCQPPGNRRH
jgi:hypothetical protein